jgi:hypothetical protein
MAQNEPCALGDAEERIFGNIGLNAQEPLERTLAYDAIGRCHPIRISPFSMMSATSSGGVTLNTLWMELRDFDEQWIQRFRDLVRM